MFLEREFEGHDNRCDLSALVGRLVGNVARPDLVFAVFVLHAGGCCCDGI